MPDTPQLPADLQKEIELEHRLHAVAESLAADNDHIDRLIDELGRILLATSDQGTAPDA